MVCLSRFPCILFALFSIYVYDCHCKQDDIRTVLKGHDNAVAYSGAGNFDAYDDSGYKGYKTHSARFFNRSHGVLIQGGIGEFHDFSVGVIIDANASAYGESIVYAHLNSVVDLYDGATAILFGNSVARIHGCNAKTVSPGISNTRVEYVCGILPCLIGHINQFHAFVFISISVIVVIWIACNRHFPRTTDRSKKK